VAQLRSGRQIWYVIMWGSPAPGNPATRQQVASNAVPKAPDAAPVEHDSGDGDERVHVGPHVEAGPRRFVQRRPHCLSHTGEARKSRQYSVTAWLRLLRALPKDPCVFDLECGYCKTIATL